MSTSQSTHTSRITAKTQASLWKAVGEDCGGVSDDIAAIKQPAPMPMGLLDALALDSTRAAPVVAPISERAALAVRATPQSSGSTTEV